MPTLATPSATLQTEPTAAGRRRLTPPSPPWATSACAISIIHQHRVALRAPGSSTAAGQGARGMRTESQPARHPPWRVPPAQSPGPTPKYATTSNLRGRVNYPARPHRRHRRGTWASVILVPYSVRRPRAFSHRSRKHHGQQLKVQTSMATGTRPRSTAYPGPIPRLCLFLLPPRPEYPQQNEGVPCQYRVGKKSKGCDSPSPPRSTEYKYGYTGC